MLKIVPVPVASSMVAGPVTLLMVVGVGAVTYVFRVPLRRRIDGLPQRQQDWVWNVVALVIIAGVLIGVPVLYAVLGFGTGSSWGQG